MFYRYFRLCLLMAGLFLSYAGQFSILNANPSRAGNANLSDYERKKIKANKDTVGLVTGSITGTYVRIGSDLADVLNREDLRVLPILGRGSLQNINDILYLRGVDLGIVQGDVLEYLEKREPGIKGRIHYITKLYNEEVHILARKEIKSLNDLRRKNVNFGKSGSGTYLTSSTIFSKLGIQVNIKTLDQRSALEKLKRNEISAMVYVVGKPASVLQSISDAGNLHILPIPYPAALRDTYLPSLFSSQDYPNLIKDNGSVPTIATSAVMAVYNWPENTHRYKKVERFIRYFFSNVPAFSEPSRHSKWKELSVAAVVPGWQRFKAAESILKEGLTNRGSEGRGGDNLQNQFQRFLASRNIQGEMNEEQQKELFEAFLKWSNR